MTNPRPVRWLTYRGDCRDAVGQVVGPDAFGAYLTAVDAEYDEATNKTRVGYAFGRRALEPTEGR